MTVSVDPIDVVVEPVVILAAPSTTPIDIMVNGPTTTIDVSGVLLAARVTESPTLVSLAVAGAQGPPGGGGSSDLVERIAAHTLSGHRCVVPNDDGEVEYADASVIDHLYRPVFFTTGATLAGEIATLTAGGVIVEPTWSWTPGLPIWLGLDGFGTQVIEPTALFVLEVSEVIEPTIVMFRPKMPIVKG